MGGTKSKTGGERELPSWEGLFYMNYREAREELAREGPAAVYLVYGDEGFLRREFLRALAHHLDLDETQSLRFQRFPGDRLEEALAACMTPSFDRRPRLVSVENPPALGGGAGEEDLLEYLESPSDISVLVCTADKVDKRRKVFTRSRAARGARVVECQALKGRELALWIAGRIKHRGKKADSDALRALASLEVPLGVLDGELEKLASYIGARDRIEADDVIKIVSVPGESSIFALVDAVGSEDPRTAVGVLGEILGGGADPLMVLGMVARQIRLIWQVRHELEGGESPREIASLLGQHPFVVEKCARQSRNFDGPQLERCLESVLVTDVGIKRGLWSAELGVERLVTLLASPELEVPEDALENARLFRNP